jgi:hypothetical protein
MAPRIVVAAASPLRDDASFQAAVNHPGDLTC